MQFVIGRSVGNNDNRRGCVVEDSSEEVGGFDSRDLDLITR